MMKIAILIISLIFIGCEQSSEIIPSGKIVKIGILTPLSGKHSHLGSQGLSGIEASNKMQSYTKEGDEILFVVEDTKSSLKGSRDAFYKLVDANVSAIVSFMGSSETLFIKDDVERSKIPLMATLATDDYITSVGGYISQVCIDNSTQVIVASHYIRDEKLIQNSGIIYDSKSQYFSALAYDFKKYFTELGGKVNFFIDINNRDEMNKFESMENSQIDILFNSTESILTEKIAKTIQEKKFNFEVFGVNGLLSGSIQEGEKSLEHLEGFYIVEHYADDVKKSGNRQELEKHLKRDNFKESSYALLSYDGYQLLVYALNNCTKKEKECLNSIMQNSDVVEGVSGYFSMINSKVKREVYVDKIENATLKKEVVVY